MKKCCKKWEELYRRVICFYPNLKNKINYCPECKKAFKELGLI